MSSEENESEEPDVDRAPPQTGPATDEPDDGDANTDDSGLADRIKDDEQVKADDPAKPNEDEQPTASSGQQRPDPSPSTEERVTSVSNNFYSTVHAGRSTFGTHSGQRGEPSRRKAQGKLRDTEIHSVTSRYAHPPGFDDAVDILRQDHVVVIEGRPGSGRRAGAIALLRRVTHGRLLVLSPVVTLRELAEREYAKRCGYLVVDRKDEGNPADVDFTWANVVDQVRDSGAYLVMTSTAVAGRAATRAVQHLSWERPPAAEMLRAHLVGNGLAEDDADSVVEPLIDALPSDCTLARLVELARLICDGKAPAEALKQLDDSAGREVRSWFAEKPTQQEEIEVTALSFLVGTDVRTFESLLARLEQSLTKRMPRKRDRPVAPKVHDIFGDRGPRLEGSGLIGFENIQSSVTTRRVMVFKDEAYQRFVLATLWDIKSNPFWDAIREWLDGIVRHGDSMEVASGLAWLACASFDEVNSSYLEPWSRGRMGWAGQVTATYLLWYMCRDEAMAPVALQTAVHWANGREINRRSTAVLAFGGELGLCYPTEAVNRLWQLITQSNDLCDVGCAGLACLFVILTDETQDDAGTVLTMLDRKMERFGTGSGGKMRANDLVRIRGLTMAAALPVVTMPSVRTGRSAIFEFLHANPERVDVVARIWAGLVCYRPCRRQAIVALRRGLYALRDISNDPTGEARALGIALSNALQLSERLPFKEDFMRVDEQLRRGQTEAPAEVLIACLDAISVKNQFGGTE